MHSQELVETPGLSFDDLPVQVLQAIITDIDGLAHFVSKQFKQLASSTTIRASTLTSVDQVKWAMKTDRSKPKMDVRCLITSPEVFKWAVENGIPVQPQTFEYTIKYGRLDTLKYAFETYKTTLLQDECEYSMLMIYAAKHGQTHILDWALNNGFKWTWHCTEAASEHGHLTTLMWAFQKNLEMGCEMLLVDAASRAGHLHILKWFLERFPSYENDVLSKGVFERTISSSAASNDRKEVLIWMREKGFNYHPRIMYYGALSKNFADMMSWLLQEGCEWYPDCLQVFQQQGMSDDVINWALAHGCPR